MPSKQSTADITPAHLPNLTEWSQSHIQRVFEAESDAQCLEAINDTFTPSLQATLNGRSVSFDDVRNFVLALRRAGQQNGGSGLRVHWEHAVEAPDDPNTNRDGSFGGAYAISGIRMPIPGSALMAEFERRKVVTVRIESQSPDLKVDSRKICDLVFVASNVRVDAQKTVSKL